MNHRGKSFLIIAYLVATAAAGFLNLFKFPLAKLMYPWDNFGMFAGYGSRHLEVIAIGTRNRGDTVSLPMKTVFPMSSMFVERGGGLGVSAIIANLQGEGRERAITRLCAYVLRHYNTSISDPSLKLHYVEIRFLSWPLTSGRQEATEKLLTHCP